MPPPPKESKLSYPNWRWESKQGDGTREYANGKKSWTRRPAKGDGGQLFNFTRKTNGSGAKLCGMCDIIPSRLATPRPGPARQRLAFSASHSRVASATRSLRLNSPSTGSTREAVTLPAIQWMSSHLPHRGYPSQITTEMHSNLRVPHNG